MTQVPEVGTDDTKQTTCCITEERDGIVFAKDAIPAGLLRMCLGRVLLLVYIHEGLSSVGQTCVSLSTRMVGESAGLDEFIVIGEGVLWTAPRE
jgi:hypothetical protein